MKSSFLICLAVVINFLVIGCSHVQKIHFYNSEAATHGSNIVEKPVLKVWRSIFCPLLPIPWNMSSFQSEVNITDAGEEFQLAASVDLDPLTWKDVYWWGPLWLPIFPKFLFNEKSPSNKLLIKIEYSKRWKTDFKENDIELMHRRADEIQSTLFPKPRRVLVRFQSTNGRTETMLGQESEIKYYSSDTQFYKYTFNLTNPIPETFEVDLELKDKSYTFILQKQERWQFAIYPPTYCGMN